MGEKVLTKENVKVNGWDKLEVITADMLKGYTVIGVNAFEGCAVKEITLPNTVRIIGIWAFSHTQLKKIVIPDSITQICWRAFESCYRLEEVMFIGNTIDVLESECFAHCYKLKKINIPKNCDNIYTSVFEGCSNVTSKFEIQDYSKPVVAYKGFEENMTCRGFQYKEGNTYEFEGEPELCKCGFHACLNPLDTFSYYCRCNSCKYHEVILEGVSKEHIVDSKVVAKKITIGRELMLSEMIEIFNKKVNGEN